MNNWIDVDEGWEPNYAEDKALAAAWAREVLADDQIFILDTETTGLGGDAELVQIAVIDVTGKKLLNTLIKPSQPIPADATRIHGIRNEDVATAPTWPEIAEMVRQLVRSASRVVIYNADYDIRILAQTCEIYGLPKFDLREGALWDCAMYWYAQWAGDWSSYHGNYRWQPLRGGDHSAMGDCLATLRYIKRMAGEDLDERPYQLGQ